MCSLKQRTSLCFALQRRPGFLPLPDVFLPHPVTPSLSFPAGFTSDATDAANPDDTAAPAHRGAPAKGGGRGSWWEEAEISGTKPSSRHPLQTEEEGLGDVTGKESWRTHPDKHATSGAGHCLSPRDSKALCAGTSRPSRPVLTQAVMPHSSPQSHCRLIPPALFIRGHSTKQNIPFSFKSVCLQSSEEGEPSWLSYTGFGQRFKLWFGHYLLCLLSLALIFFIYKMGIITS